MHTCNSALEKMRQEDSVLSHSELYREILSQKPKQNPARQNGSEGKPRLTESHHRNSLGEKERMSPERRALFHIKQNKQHPPQHTQNQKFLNSRVRSLFYCPTFVSSLTTDTQGSLSYPAGHKAKPLLPWRGWVGQVPVLRQLAWSL